MDDATISGSVLDSSLGNVGTGLDSIPVSTPLTTAIVAAAPVLPIGGTVGSEPINPVVSVASVATPSTSKGKKGKGKGKTRTPKMEKRGRGRPNVYVGAILQLMLSMIRACHNSSLVRSVLTGLANPGKELTADQKRTYKTWRLGLAKACDLPVLTKPLTISLPMLGKYAAEAGIEMPLGKPSFATKAKQEAKLEQFINKKIGKKATTADAA